MFSHSVRLFDLFGFEIRIDASWLLIAALIVWSLSSGYFPEVLPGLDASGYLILSVVAMLGLFGSLILHELAHSLVARRYGLGVGGITLFLFGGVAQLEDEPKSAASEFWIAIAGPAMSFALAGAFGLLAVAAGGGVAGMVLSYLASINLILAVFNLVPAFPLDGGRVLRAWLWNRSGDVLEATRKASTAGVVFALALMALGLFSVLSGGGVGGIWMGLIGLFVLNASRGTYQHLVTQTSLRGLRVSELMTPNPFCATPDMTLADLADEVMLAHGISFVPVVEAGVLLGHVDTALMREVPRADWGVTQVGDIFAALSEDTAVRPDLSAEEALNLMASGPQRKLLVAEGRSLVGVLSIRDLMAHIAIVQDLGRGTRR
ncbi:site-2 protease family protein [Roseibacterium beibuensis]|uniref:Zinc metalloprotease n=1 Tax=[Roseibacterium] beibuensis TaxID=1193142 RepID=A0ABP9LBH7_9RHOB|nr:site-2 protease family protein [Roseibacterium beibuensis]MCS6624299.1 site-2 protease family protein [Roseibacterium beibuensis]